MCRKLSGGRVRPKQSISSNHQAGISNIQYDNQSAVRVRFKTKYFNQSSGRDQQKHIMVSNQQAGFGQS